MQELNEALEGLAVIQQAQELTNEQLVELMPTAAIEAHLKFWTGILNDPATTPPMRAKSKQMVDLWEFRQRASRTRDALVADRQKQHPGCFCLGRGGKGGVAMTFLGVNGETLLALDDGHPVETFEEWCDCPAGDAASARADEIRDRSREEYLARRRDRASRLAAIPDIYEGMTSESWVEKAQEQGATEAQVKAVLGPLMRWHKAVFDQPVVARRQNLLLLGGRYGTGKTALAAIVARAWLDRGKSVIFRSAAEWFSALRAAPLHTYQGEEPTELALINHARECDLFVLDDWGGEAMSPSSEQRLVEQTSLVLDHRITHGKATILTTNLLPQEAAERVGQRILDRVTSDLISVRINFETPNLRQAKTW
jgi:DNA replication protein DnaC